MGYVKGLVSVIIPTYQRAELLSRAIDSVLNQTYKNIECIVVNDNIPNDEYSVVLYKLLEKYKSDKRFVFLEQERHINGAEARNCGIRNAKGEYIAFLDDDDWWKPEKIEHQVDFILRQSNTCGGVSTLVEFYTNNKPFRWSRPYKDGKISLQILRREVDVTTCSIMLRHEALDDAGYFDNALRRHQEIQLLSFFTAKYELKLLPEHLTCVNCDDSVRNPSADQILVIKKSFFESVKPIMDLLSESERRSVYTVHHLEVALVEFREKKYWKAFRTGLKAISTPSSVWRSLKAIGRRKQEYKCPNYIRRES